MIVHELPNGVTNKLFLFAKQRIDLDVVHSLEHDGRAPPELKKSPGAGTQGEGRYKAYNIPKTGLNVKKSAHNA
jgi:hypothetical protein